MHCWRVHGFVGFPKDFMRPKIFTSLRQMRINHMYFLEKLDGNKCSQSGLFYCWPCISEGRLCVGWLIKKRMLVSQGEHRHKAAANRNVTRREKTEVLIPVSLNLGFTEHWFFSLEGCSCPAGPGALWCRSPFVLVEPFSSTPLSSLLGKPLFRKTQITEQLNNLKLQ